MQTLGDVIMWGLVIAAMIIVPYKLAKAWVWPYIKPIIALIFGGPSVKHYQADDDNVMSRSAVNDSPVVPVPAIPVPGTQLNAADVARNLTEDQIVEVLALMRNARGKHLYSGKKIYALVGGNYGAFLAKMRTLRGDDKDDMPEEPTILTPIARRPTKASYYQDDPELTYQPPN